MIEIVIDGTTIDLRPGATIQMGKKFSNPVTLGATSVMYSATITIDRTARNEQVFYEYINMATNRKPIYATVTFGRMKIGGTFRVLPTIKSSEISLTLTEESVSIKDILSAPYEPMSNYNDQTRMGGEFGELRMHKDGIVMAPALLFSGLVSQRTGGKIQFDVVGSWASQLMILQKITRTNANDSRVNGSLILKNNSLISLNNLFNPIQSTGNAVMVLNNDIQIITPKSQFVNADEIYNAMIYPTIDGIAQTSMGGTLLDAAIYNDTVSFTIRDAPLNSLRALGCVGGKTTMLALATGSKRLNISSVIGTFNTSGNAVTPAGLSWGATMGTSKPYDLFDTWIKLNCMWWRVNNDVITCSAISNTAIVRELTNVKSVSYIKDYDMAKRIGITVTDDDNAQYIDFNPRGSEDSGVVLKSPIKQVDNNTAGQLVYNNSNSSLEAVEKGMWLNKFATGANRVIACVEVECIVSMNIIEFLDFSNNYIYGIPELNAKFWALEISTYDVLAEVAKIKFLKYE